MKYKLRVRCEIQQTDDHGGFYGQGLTVEETADLSLDTFMDVAAVLGQFHELTKTVKTDHA